MSILRKAILFFLFAMAAAGTVRAQVLVPYFGKNNVKYDTFHWKTYKTEHFEFFFYAEEEEHCSGWPAWRNPRTTK